MAWTGNVYFPVMSRVAEVIDDRNPKNGKFL